MSNPLPEHHEDLLKRIFSIGEDGTLSEAVIEIYDELRRTMRVLGSGVTEHQLVLIPFLLNRIPREPVRTFISDVEDGAVSRGDFIVAKWRKKWQFGNYVTCDKKNQYVTVVLDDGTGEERRLLAGDVRLPTKQELEVVTKV